MGRLPVQSKIRPLAEKVLSEAQIQAEILRYFVGREDIRIWRNNTGRAVGKDGAWISFGLVGSADLIGLRKARRYSPPVGQFVAIECKAARGRQTKAQVFFQRMVESMGGIYVLARSVEDVQEAGL